MTTILTENLNRTANYIVSEDSSMYLSREQVTLASGHVYKPGMVLGKLTANGKYVPLAATAADPATGSHVPTAICFDDYDATDADVRGVVTARHAQVHAAMLIWPAALNDAGRNTALAALASNFKIIAR